MSAPVLTVKEQKASLSGKKKKKKTMKNVLGIPNSLKVESHCVELNEVRKLIKTLERLLPSARLPLEREPKNSNEQTVDSSQLRAEAMKKRNQLSLGVNALNRSIKQDLISSVLLANDIQPKFLIHHLNLLCSYNKIPFVEMPRLREITKNSLGFPCIAVGFKKDFCDFSEVVEEVRSISEAKSIVSNDESKEPVVDVEEEEEDVDNVDNKVMVNSLEIDEPPFEYLYRTSTKERVFVPDTNEQSKQKPEMDFLVIKDDKSETKLKRSSTNLGISGKFKANQKKRLKKKKLHNKYDDDDDDDDDEDLEVPKKKMKKDWVIDTVGTKQKINYHPANVVRFSSNPDRNKRRNK